MLHMCCCLHQHLTYGFTSQRRMSSWAKFLIFTKQNHLCIFWVYNNISKLCPFPGSKYQQVHFEINQVEIFYVIQDSFPQKISSTCTVVLEKLLESREFHMFHIKTTAMSLIFHSLNERLNKRFFYYYGLNDLLNALHLLNLNYHISYFVLFSTL